MAEFYDEENVEGQSESLTMAEFIKQLSVESVLIFTTGCRRQPAMGLDPPPSIQFQHEEPCRLPSVSTCAMVLYLPIQDKYNAFAKKFVATLKGGNSFSVI